MINLIVDEAYAFDYLSILHIKKNNTLADSINFDNCSATIISQVGHALYKTIIASEQYNNLIKANQLVYDQIEKVRMGNKLDAKEVDDANMLRFKYKIELQKVFFNTELIEQKTPQNPLRS
ncbi:MAG: hypothetical protein ORN21_05370 [Methylophilaceae bacterium]|nr:hypothetical protein [Methylophilaceae bacterium]